MDIFEELGLHRYINAQDTFTTYGASCMPAASLRAMREIASSCVELAEVQAKTGDALAKLTHNEGAYISNGAAGGIMVATAAALARDDEKFSIPCRRSPARGTRLSCRPLSATCMTAAAQLSAQNALYRYSGHRSDCGRAGSSHYPGNGCRVLCHLFGRDASLPLETMVEVAHRHGVPVIVDAAAQNPPAENL